MLPPSGGFHSPSRGPSPKPAPLSFRWGHSNDGEPVDEASLAAAVANAAMLANCLRPGGERGLGGGCCLEDGERLRRHFGLGEEKLCLTVTRSVPDACD